MVKSFEEWWNKEGLLYFGIGTEQDAREIWNAAQATEREACAKVCVDESYKGQSREVVALACSKAIRARGNNGK